MSVKATHTADVRELREKVAGLHVEAGNERVKEIVDLLISVVFQPIEAFDVTPEEFWSAFYYVAERGKSGEASLLAPGLGMDKYLDIRMDAQDEAAGLAGGTPRTIEGPLYVAGAPLADGFARMDDGTDETGEAMLLTGQVTDEDGKPLANAIVDVWHADSKGNYSYFDKSQSDFNLRRRIKTDENGRYVARSIIPSGYGCPPEGSTQALLNLLGRHGQRPAHIHFFISAPGHKHLTTQINLAGDQFTYDDFAFATRDELVVEARPVEHSAIGEQHGVTGPITEVVFDFQLVSTDKAELQARHERKRALEDAVVA